MTTNAFVSSGKPAITHYRVRERFQAHTLLECGLETGRTHQIRVHLNAIQHPVVGDDRYRGGRKGLPVTLARPFLHARELAFDHPATGERVTFESRLPPDLTRLLELLG